MSQSHCEACGRTTRHALQTRDLRGRWSEFAIDRCLRCGIGRSIPKPGDPYQDEAARTTAPIPADELQAEFDLNPVRSPWAEEIARVLIEAKVPEEVLDIGCAEGELLWHLSQGGLRCRGLELRPKAVQVATAIRGQAVEVGSVESFLQGSQTAGTIILSHVLEHLDEPVPVLSRLSRKARVIAVAVPNSLSVRALVEWSGATQRFAYAPSEHIWQMTVGGVRGLFSRAGLVVDAIVCCPLRPRRRSVRDTLRGPGPRPAVEAAPQQDGSQLEGSQLEGSPRKGFLRKATWQVFDRSLLAVEKRIDASWLGDQIVALGHAR